jgi:WD40 repeat protein
MVENCMSADSRDTSGKGGRRRWKRLLALWGAGLFLACGLIAAWLLPAPTKAADRTIAGEPESPTFRTTPFDPRPAAWIGPLAWDVRFLESGTLLATGGPRNPLSVRDLTRARPDWTPQPDWTVCTGRGPDNLTWPHAFSVDGTVFAGVLDSARRSLRIWQVPSPRERATIELDGRSIEQLGFSADGRRLAIAWLGRAATSYRDSVGMTIVEVQTGAERASLSVHSRATAMALRPAMVISADSQTLAIRRGTDVLELWDVPSSRRRGTIRAETGYDQVCMSEWVFSPDGAHVSTLLAGGAIGVWDAITCQEKFRDEHAVAPARERPFFQSNWSNLGETAGRPLAFSKDSTTLAVACRDGAVHLWDIPTAQLRTVLPPPVPPLESSGVIVFSGDARYLALAGEGTPRARIDRLPGAVRDLLHRVEDRDSAQWVGRLIVWDLTTRRHRLVAQAGGRFSAVAFAPDGSRLAAAREEFSDSGDRFYWGDTVRDVMLWSLE